MIVKVMVSGSYAAAVLAAVPTTNDDLIGWLLKAIFGLMLAIIAYFVKKIADQISANQVTLDKHGRMLRRHNVLFLFYLKQAQADLESRGGENGRRKADQSLVSLLEAVAAEGELEDA